jgi:uncharacterized protein YndB with AHSA1/START domain
MNITVETTIAASPEIVFATMTDIVRWPEFVHAIEKVEMLDPGHVGVGTRFRETRSMFGRSATEEMTVAALEPPLRMVFTADSHGAHYVTTHVIVPEGVRSRLVLSFEGEPVTIAAKLFSVISSLFVASLRRHIEGDLADMKAEAERRARP